MDNVWVAQGPEHINPDGSIVHPRRGDNVIIGDNVTIGTGVILGYATRIHSGAHLGDHISIGNGTIVDCGAYIGDLVHIGNYAYVGVCIRLGVNVRIGDNVRLCNYNANLSLERYDILCAGRDIRGFEFIAYRIPRGYRITAGCRDFSPEEARKHWTGKEYKDISDMSWRSIIAKLDYLDAEAARRGWTV